MKITNVTELGSLVRSARKRKGLSQTELAEQLGTTRQWLSRFEQGSNDVSLGAVFSALDALQIDLTLNYPLEESVAPLESTPSPSVENSSMPEDRQNRGAEGLSGERSLEAAGLLVPSAKDGARGKVDRFSRMRQRDALGGVGERFSTRGPGSLQRSAESNAATDGMPSAQEILPTQNARGTLDGQSSKKPGTGSSIKYSIDADIARISNSSLFRKK